MSVDGVSLRLGGMARKHRYARPTTNALGAEDDDDHAPGSDHSNRQLIASASQGSFVPVHEEQDVCPLVIPLPSAYEQRDPDAKRALANKRSADMDEHDDESAQSNNGDDDKDVKEEEDTALLDREMPSMTPGLHLMAGKKKAKKRNPNTLLAAEPSGQQHGRATGVRDDVPLTLLNRPGAQTQATDEAERLRVDMQHLPDAPDEGAFDRIPVTEFGKAALRGMGWREGQAFGRGGMAVPVEYVPRARRLGLGADPTLEPTKKLPGGGAGDEGKPSKPKRKRIRKPGEPKEAPARMVLPRDADGRQRHVRSLDEALVEARPEGLQAGSLVAVVAGVHEGMAGRVVAMLGSGGWTKVRLANDEQVRVHREDLHQLDPRTLSKDHPVVRMVRRTAGLSSPRPRRPAEASSGDGGKGKKERKEKKKDKKKEKKGDKKKKQKKKQKKASKAVDEAPTWLRPHVVVRIVSKSFERGRLYNKRVRVVDVYGIRECMVRTEDGSMVQGVRQSMVETALPKPGGRVMVVCGPHRGQIGALQERNSRENRAVVRFDEDLQFHTLAMDDVAQYDGP